MKYYNLKFAYRIFSFLIYPLVAFIFGTRWFYGIHESIDMWFALFLLFIYLIRGLIDEGIELDKFMHQKRTEDKNIIRIGEGVVSENPPSIEVPYGVCPECRGEKKISWEAEEKPLECWNCSGRGTV